MTVAADSACRAGLKSLRHWVCSVSLTIKKRIRAGQSDPPCCRLWIWTVNPCTLFTSVLDYGSIFVISGGDVLRKTEEIRPLM